MAQPDFMIAKPTEARSKFSLMGTTLDSIKHDSSWVKSQLEKPEKGPSVLHECYEDPFLRMTAYRFEDRMKRYKEVDKEYRDKEREALYFSNPQLDLLGVGGERGGRGSKMLPLNYNRSETNDKLNNYRALPPKDIYEMNRVGLKPMQADRLPTGNYNYAKYRPRKAYYPFEENGIIVEKTKSKSAHEPISASRFPTIRENIMRDFIAFDAKKDLSRSKYKTLSDALKKDGGLPENIKHKYLLTRGGKVGEKEGEGIVKEDDIRELFEKYDEAQLEMMERHLALEKRKQRIKDENVNRSVQEDIGATLRGTIGGASNWPMNSEFKENFHPDEYERSRKELPPPDEARRRRDSHTKWVGLNVLDQKHRQEWREYLEAKQPKN